MSDDQGELTTFNDLAEGDKRRILGRLNFTDLKICRLVSKSWNFLVTSTESFRRKTILCVSLGHYNKSAMSSTTVAWNHIRLEISYADENGQQFWNELPTPPFSHVQILEFKRCSLCWASFRKLVNLCPSLHQITFNRSLFKDKYHGLSSEEREIFLVRTSSVKVLTIIDVGDVEAVTEILEKMVVFQTSCLETLKIEYKSFSLVRLPEAVHFLQVLTEMILCNKLTLKNLILNIRNSEILNQFVRFFFTPLQPFNRVLQLRVFKIATPLPDTDNVSVTEDSSRFLVRLADFLRAQRYLVSLAFPNLQNLDGAEGRRWSILDSTTKHLEKLRVPGAMYLRRNLLKSFHSLKFLFIGEKNFGSPATFLQPTKFNMDRGGMARRNVAKVCTLSIYAHIIYESGNLFHVLEKFPNLTCFEFNGFRPLFNDKDVQAIIKYLSNLRHLVIAHCDLITDTGITGIPAETCEDLIRFSTLYVDDIKVTKNLGIQGSPLSNLKCLVTLHLIGNSQISDVGIKFGLEFENLRLIHLPYSKRITEWGIQQLGDQNPCLESVILTRATEEVAIGLAKVKTTHKRLARTIVQNLIKLDEEMIQSTLLNGILWNQL